MAWSEGVPYILDAKIRGKLVVLPIAQLRHARVVVKSTASTEEPSEWYAFVSYRIVRVW